ncbi:MAG: VacJ family lipoprotein [Azonexus sp.]
MRTKLKASAFKARTVRSLLALGGILLASLSVAAENPHDPYENFNRSMYAVNKTLDTYVTRPVAQAYDAAVPLPAKAGAGNFFGNVGEVWIGANSLLQGKPGDAGDSLARLLVNSTIGIFGLFDVASELGIERHNEDLGQTFAVWGAKESSYVFLPIIGPRTVRDTAGWAVEFFTDPLMGIKNYHTRYGAVALRFVDLRAGLLPADKIVEEAAIDEYAYVRDAYLQRRQNLIYDGRPPRLDD